MDDRNSPPADYADQVPAAWKEDPATHWYLYGAREASQTRDDEVLTAYLRGILPEVSERDDLEPADRIHLLRLVDFLGKGSARRALNDCLDELATFLRYEPDLDQGADNYTSVKRLMGMLRTGVERQTAYRVTRAEYHRGSQSPD